MVTTTDTLSKTEYELLYQLKSTLLPTADCNREALNRLINLEYVRVLSGNKAAITRQGLDVVADQRGGLPMLTHTPDPASSTVAPEQLKHDRNGVKAAPVAAIDRPHLSEKSLEGLLEIHEAGEDGFQVAGAPFAVIHPKTVARLKTLGLIIVLDGKAFYTPEGESYLREEGLLPSVNGVKLPAYEDVGAQFADTATEQEIDDAIAERIAHTPDAEDDPPTPDDAPNQIEIAVSADTPAEALATLRELTDAIEQGLVVTPGEAAAAEYLHDDEDSEGSNGCGECLDCLDKRVLAMLMAARPEVAAIYNAEAARESAEMRRDSLLRAFEGAQN